MPSPRTRRTPAAAAEARRYTVDELAAAAGLPSRTIRFYQSQGVLPPPARRGRRALYDQRHLERLRLVGALRERGLRLRAVRHVVAADADGARLIASRLGLGDSLGKPWSDDEPRTLAHAALVERIGADAAGTIASLLRLGVVERAGREREPVYRVRSPGLLEVTLALQRSGIDVDTAVRGGAILWRRLGTAARELVEHFSRHAGRGFGRSTAPAEIGAALDALRPLAGEAVRLLFARQIERALRDRFGAARAVPRVPRRPDGRR